MSSNVTCSRYHIAKKIIWRWTAIAIISFFKLPLVWENILGNLKRMGVGFTWSYLIIDYHCQRTFISGVEFPIYLFISTSRRNCVTFIGERGIFIGKYMFRRYSLSLSPLPPHKMFVLERNKLLILYSCESDSRFCRSVLDQLNVITYVNYLLHHSSISVCFGFLLQLN